MSHSKTHRSKYGQKSNLLPGTPVYTGTMDVAPKATCTCYNKNTCSTKHFDRLSDFVPSDCKDEYWLHVCGLNQAEQIAALGKQLHLHPLLIEDILNINKQPKIEEFDNCVLVILKRFNFVENDDLAWEQISLVLADDFVLSFQESDQPAFTEIRRTLENNIGIIRRNGPDYLFTLLIDRVVDSYLPEMDKTEELLVEMEGKILDDDRETNIREMILYNRKRHQILKKAIFPLKESFPRLMRLDINLIEKPTTTYLRDVYDHIDFAAHSIELNHETLLGLMNLYTSNNDLRMNRIMQRLTVVSTVFIPLSFLAGIWGMNFEIMPELHWKYGYLFAWGIIAIAGISIWIYLKRKMY